MKTRVFLVRHGATILSNEDRFAGSTDVPLGTDGRDQVERLADRLGAAPIAAAYCSPMWRTVETAEVVARPHGIHPVAVDALREIDHGRWEGRRRADVQRAYPDEYAAWERDPFTCAPLAGESGGQVLARALPALDAIVRRHRQPSRVRYPRLSGSSRAVAGLSEPPRLQRSRLGSTGAAERHLPLPAARNRR